MAEITETTSSETLTGTSSSDSISGGDGSDIINSGSGSDVIDGGSGSDWLNAGAGDDTLVYILSENLGEGDLYIGGSGIDTVRLVFTGEQWASAIVQAEIERYQQHLLAVATSGSGQVSNGSASDFTFDFGDGTTLTVSMMEKVEFVVTNRLPVANDMSIAVNEDAAVTVAFDADDADDDDTQASLTYTVVDQPAQGEVTVNPDGTFTFEAAGPDSLAAGETTEVTFTYKATDRHGSESEIRTVTITVNGVNDQPVLQAQDAGTLTDNSFFDVFADVTGQLDADDVDSDDDPTTLVYALDEGENGDGAYGTLVVGAGASYTYNPDDDAINALNADQVVSDTFSVRATDRHGEFDTELVSLTLVGANDKPVLQADDAETLTDTAVFDVFADVTGQLDADDVDSDDDPITLLYALDEDEDGVGAYGTLVVDEDGGYTYNPDDEAINALSAGQVVSETFRVRATDRHGAFDTELVSLRLVGSNDGPRVSAPVTVEVDEDTAAAIGQVRVSDADDDILSVSLSVDSGTLTVSDSTAGGLAAAVIGGNGTGSVMLTGTAAQINATLADVAGLVYGPVADYHGAASLSIEVDDGQEAVSTVVGITVHAVVDEPSLQVQDASGDEDLAIALSIDAALADTDGSESLSIEISGVPDGAMLSAGEPSGPGTWRLTPAELASLTITPAAGDARDFDLTVIATSTEEESGGTANTQRTIHVNVNAIVDTPTLSVEDAVGDEDTAIPLNIRAALGDTDGSETLSIKLEVFSPVSLSAGTNHGDNFTWTLTPEQLTGLTLTPALNDAGGGIPSLGDILILVTATATESEGGGSMTTDPYPLWVTVNAVADTPALVIDTLAPTGGPEMRVSTFTAGDQTPAEARQAIAVLERDDFIVTWSSAGQDGSVDGVYAQRFDAGGNRVGAEFRVNATTANAQGEPTIAALEDGGFVTVWQSLGQDGAASSGVYAQRFDREGLAVDGEFRVNSTTAGDQASPSVAKLGDGGFVVAWESPDGNGTGIYAQRYNAAGDTDRAEFRVNTLTSGAQSDAKVAGLADGGFVVVWVDNGDAVIAQRYDAGGSAVGEEFIVFAGILTGTGVGSGVAALAGGGFVVTTGDSLSVGAALYDSAGRRNTTPDSEGQPREEVIDVGDHFGPVAAAPSVAGLPGGGFVVSWLNGSDGQGTEIHAQRFDAVGTKVGEVLTTGNEGDGNLQFHSASVGGFSDGGFVLSWGSRGEDGSGEGVHARTFSGANAAGSEDTGIPLPQVAAFLVDTDGSEEMQIAITGAPPGSRLHAGDGSSFDVWGDWTFPLGQLLGSNENGWRVPEMMFSPPVDFNGTIELTVTATATESSNSDAASISDTLRVTVFPVNDAPMAVDDLIDVSNDTNAITIPAGMLLGNDSDRDGPSLTISSVGSPSSNLTNLALDANGTIRFDSGAAGTGSFSYTVSDGAGASATATVNVRIVPANDNEPYPSSSNDIERPRYLAAGGSDDTLFGGNLDDVLFGGAGADRLEGGGGNDILNGDAGNDELHGSDGDDILRGGGGNDTIHGGSGVDLLDLSDASGAFVFDAYSGSEVAINGTDVYDNIEGVIGNGLANTFTSPLGGTFIVRGGGGDDTIEGAFGFLDLLDFSDATGPIDFTVLRAPDDQDPDNDFSITPEGATPGLGQDRYRDVEGVIGGAYDDSLTGTDHDDVLRGGGGNDILVGAGGNDILVGSAGIDLMSGGAGSDTFVLSRAGLGAVDVITDFAVGLDGDLLDFDDLFDHGFREQDLALRVSGGNTIISAAQDGFAEPYVDVVTLLGVTTTLTDLLANNIKTEL